MVTIGLRLSVFDNSSFPLRVTEIEYVFSDMLHAEIAVALTLERPLFKGRNDRFVN